MARLTKDRQEAWREALERAIYGKAPREKDEKLLEDLDSFLAKTPNEIDFVWLEEEDNERTINDIKRELEEEAVNSQL